MYRLIFFGTSDFSVPSLEALLKDARFEVVAVVTKPDAPIGRHQVLTPPPVKVMAQEHDVPVLQFDKIKTDETYEILKQACTEEIPNQVRDDERVQDDKPVDVFVVVSYGKIIPQRILDLPKHGCINVHGSLLPRWRGASCVQAAIAAGDEKSGITIMMMDAEMDHGDLLAQKEIAIAPDETGGRLHDRLSLLGAEALPDVLVGYLQGAIKPRPQDHAQAIYCKLLSRDDGKIDWNKSAAELERLIRAYDPWPGSWTEWDEKRIKLINVKCITHNEKPQNQKMGQPFVQNGIMPVLCGDGNCLEILELQPEGKKVMTAKEYILGHQAKTTSEE